MNPNDLWTLKSNWVTSAWQEMLIPHHCLLLSFALSMDFAFCHLFLFHIHQQMFLHIFHTGDYQSTMVNLLIFKSASSTNISNNTVEESGETKKSLSTKNSCQLSTEGLKLTNNIISPKMQFSSRFGDMSVFRIAWFDLVTFNKQFRPSSFVLMIGE